MQQAQAATSPGKLALSHLCRGSRPRAKSPFRASGWNWDYGAVADPYLDGVYRWWHLTGPSPELLAAEADGWLGAADTAGPAVDIGCGLGSEIAHLAASGWDVVGIDLSEVAVQQASRERGQHSQHSQHGFVRADVLALPFPAESFGLALDRGCFHYLPQAQWTRYAAETARVLRPAGRLLLRACLNSRGIRNEVTEQGIRSAFADWIVDSLTESQLISDTRTMPTLTVRLRRGWDG
jgi:SAM-dependent methyltransferase